MKKAAFLMVLLAFLVSSCAPSLVYGENWVRSVFAPSGAARDQACKIGFRYGQDRRFGETSLPGILELSNGTQSLKLYTAVGGAHLYCSLFGLSGKLPDSIPPFTTFVNLVNTEFPLEKLELSVEFYGEQNVVLGQFNFAKRIDGDKEIIFSMPQMNNQEISVLDAAKNFDLVLTENGEEKRFTVNAGSGKGLF
jgi:hypothetical protein